jgi:hypothetical protein
MTWLEEKEICSLIEAGFEYVTSLNALNLSAIVKALDVVVSTDSNGATKLTFTGISEIIVAVPTGIALAIGTYVRMTNKK